MHKPAADRVKPGPESAPAHETEDTSPRLPSWLAEIEKRIRSAPSLLETLTDEDWEFFRNYDSPEVLGPPPPPPMKRRPRRRGES